SPLGLDPSTPLRTRFARPTGWRRHLVDLVLRIHALIVDHGTDSPTGRSSRDAGGGPGACLRWRSDPPDRRLRIVRSDYPGSVRTSGQKSLRPAEPKGVGRGRSATTTPPGEDPLIMLNFIEAFFISTFGARKDDDRGASAVEYGLL